MKALSLALLMVVTIIIFGCGPETIKYDTKYELQRVPEEGNIKLVLITSEQDALWKIDYTPATINDNIPVKLFDISKDGNKILFVGQKDKPKTNLFVKSLGGSKAVLQRTFREYITDGVFSPDGKSITFSEWKNGNTKELFYTDAESGVATRQMTNTWTAYAQDRRRQPNRALHARHEPAAVCARQTQRPRQRGTLGKPNAKLVTPPRY